MEVLHAFVPVRPITVHDVPRHVRSLLCRVFRDEEEPRRCVQPVHPRFHGGAILLEHPSSAQLPFAYTVSPSDTQRRPESDTCEDRLGGGGRPNNARRSSAGGSGDEPHTLGVPCARRASGRSHAPPLEEGLRRNPGTMKSVCGAGTRRSRASESQRGQRHYESGCVYAPVYPAVPRRQVERLGQAIRDFQEHGPDGA